MERKTTQRIIGILVVAALIVILLPLLFNGSAGEASKQTAEVKAPPFPDQTPQPSSTETLAQQAPQAASGTLAQQSPAVTPQPDQNQSGSLDISQNTANTVNTLATPTPATIASADPAVATANPLVTAESTPAPVVTTQAPAQPLITAAVAQPIAAANAAAPTKDAVPATVTAKLDEAQTTAPVVVHEHAIEPKLASQTQKSKHAKAKQPMTHQDLVQLKNSAWVVQMGSFKNKTNAIRLTNKLRAEGYKAFTREVKSTLRVYVGPEFKQASAASLANKLQQELNMHGIIVSYNPLEL